MSLAEQLQTFVQFCQTHITGDEKGEAQVFLDRFFRAFGHEGAIEAGATYEKRIEKGSKKGKTGFADLVWKPRVLIEMKRRGADLSKHYSQAFDYWQRAIPNRPRYVMLCNFDQFWIYDFDIQIDTPLDTVLLTELPDRISTFGFMLPREQVSVFGNNQVEVTEKAARRLGQDLYPYLRDRIQRQSKRSQPEAALMAQRFVLQCVLAMFAEDRGLLPDSLFIRCVQNCIGGKSSYDVISQGLFREMNRPGITLAGQFKGVDYFNGGLFSTIDEFDLTLEELRVLEVVALEDWSKIRPAIFGNIFESAIDAGERHAHGIHYTSEADIMKIVRPTISRYWEERIEGANTLQELTMLQEELRNYRVLDPACGSGNFLYLAYQELKRIEQDLLDKIAERRRSNTGQKEMGFVTPLQFFGIDSNRFAVELARVTLVIARKVAIDTLNLVEPALPLDTLDDNIVCKDALFTEWPKANAIIGNPPFLGGKYMRKALGNDYVEKIFNRFSDVKDSVDFCSYWFRTAHQSVYNYGRVGLVGTNSISQGKSRAATLGYIIHNGGHIHDAISTQPWSGEANVHVSIVNWSFDAHDTCILNSEVVKKINSSLTHLTNVQEALRINANSGICFTGITPVGKGFVISEEKALKWIEIFPENQNILFPFVEGKDLVSDTYKKLKNWVIDFNDMTIEEASYYREPFEWVKSTVKPERESNRRELYQKYWWKLGERRPAMRQSLSSLSSYFAVPQTSKWAIFMPTPTHWLPNARTRIISSDDFYILGILTSRCHRVWMMAQMSTLEDRISYTHNTCFETFPFPQTPSRNIVDKIRAAAVELHEYRSQQMEQKQWGITKLYNAYFDEPASQLYKLHQKLDALVLKAYGFNPDDDLLEKLLTLNLQLAAQEQAGETVIGPWAPS